MTTTNTNDRVGELFADAREVHAQAVARLEEGDIWDAAEKAGVPPSGRRTVSFWQQPERSPGPRR